MRALLRGHALNLHHDALWLLCRANLLSRRSRPRLVVPTDCLTWQRSSKVSKREAVIGAPPSCGSNIVRIGGLLYGSRIAQTDVRELRDHTGCYGPSLFDILASMEQITSTHHSAAFGMLFHCSAHGKHGAKLRSAKIRPEGQPTNLRPSNARSRRRRSTRAICSHETFAGRSRELDNSPDCTLH